MSKQEADIIRGLKAMVTSTNSLIPGKVGDVDVERMTCDVCDVDGFVWHDVRMQALIPAGKGLKLVPEKNSDVIIGRIDGTDCFGVLLYSKIADVKLNISGQLALANPAENLLGLINGLLDLLSQAVMTTPAGPGNFAPPTIQKLTEIKMRFGKLFTEE